MRALAAFLALSMTTGLVPTPAFAQAPSNAELAQARELFAQGVKLEEAHDWAGALEKFRQTAAIKQSPAVHFHLGLCLQNTGKLGGAYVQFQRAVAGAELEQTPAAALISAKAKEHLGDLAGKVPFAELHLPSGLVDLRIFVDGRPAALEKTSIALDPGEHRLRVEAEGRTPFELVFTVAVGEQKTIDVALPVVATPPPPPPVVLRPPPVATPARPWPWVIGIVGVASLAGAGVMYGYRASAIAELEGACGNGHSDCPPSKRSVADHGRTYATVGNVLLGVGGVALTTATIWLLWPSSASSSSEHAKSPTTGSVQPYVGGPSLLGVGLTGSF